MKRTTFIIAIILLFPLSMRAQISLQVHGGLNIANLSDPGNLVEGAVWKSRLGLVASASTSIPMTDRLSISPGLRFVQKGTRSEWSSFSTGHVDAKVTNSYLELPAYLEWRVLAFGARLYVVVGPTFSYLLNSRMEATTQLYGESHSNVVEIVAHEIMG